MRGFWPKLENWRIGNFTLCVPSLLHSRYESSRKASSDVLRDDSAAREIMYTLDDAIPIGCKSCNLASILMRAAFNNISDCICSACVHARIREQS